MTHVTDWARPLFDDESLAYVGDYYQRADAFLFGRRTYEMFLWSWGPARGGVHLGARLFPDSGPDLALDLVETRAFPKGITLQTYRTAGRPHIRIRPHHVRRSQHE